MAITTKARAKGLLRDARALLADKTLPKAVSDALEAVEVALKKNWADLAAEVEAEAPEADVEPEQPAPVEESAALQGEIVPLIERAVGKDGTVPIKMIQAGWGSSGYYSKELLQRDGPMAFPAGTQMFWNHATPTEESERPEGNLAHLAAVTVATPAWQESGPAGPGLYSKAKVFGQYAQALDELAPHIGVSIRGHGVVRAGEADGRKGLIVEKLLPGRSVDFVTTPGAGGQVLSLFEAARGGRDAATAAAASAQDDSQGRVRMNEEEIRGLQEAKTASDAEVARLREALLLRDARDVTVAELAKIEMPDVTRARLTESLAARPVITDGALDLEATKARIAEAAKEELAYLVGVGASGSGRITGMGGAGNGQPAGDVSKLAAAMQKLGLTEAAAQAAAHGR